MKVKVNSRRKSTSNIGTSEEGKIHKAKRYSHQEDDKNEKKKIKVYLSMLQNLVPFAPKNKKLSNLEVISNVIDYIHDLRETLGLQPCNADFDMDSMSQCGNVQYPSDLEISNNSSSLTPSPVSKSSRISQSVSVLNQPIQYDRQPLGVIPNPN